MKMPFVLLAVATFAIVAALVPFLRRFVYRWSNLVFPAIYIVIGGGLIPGGQPLYRIALQFAVFLNGLEQRRAAPRVAALPPLGFAAAALVMALLSYFAPSPTLLAAGPTRLATASSLLLAAASWASWYAGSRAGAARFSPREWLDDLAFGPTGWAFLVVFTFGALTVVSLAYLVPFAALITYWCGLLAAFDEPLSFTTGALRVREMKQHRALMT